VEKDEQFLVELRVRVHQLTNRLQTILGYIELDRCKDALPHISQAGRDLAHLGQTIAHRASQMKDEGCVADDRDKKADARDAKADIRERKANERDVRARRRARAPHYAKV
jgi:hypothetical protein